MSPQYETVIGLEVHVQLQTQTKLFCSDCTEFGSAPNTQVSSISLGHPGTLPRLNKEAIGMAVKLGLATNCSIVQHNYFARKHYFYPDLPKGYQISQHTTPVCRNGFVQIQVEGQEKKVRIHRIHMEEDAGKSMHDPENNTSNLDFNRAGTPLLEIVTEPDIRSAAEAGAFVTTLRKLIRLLGVSDGNMEEGSLRCDVNISLRKAGAVELGTRVEIKNLNSIRFIRKAIDFEKERLAALLDIGQPVVQQTRGFDESAGTTYAIRTKEDEEDYRYFPEPDLPPFFISDTQIENLRQQLPPMPEEIKKQLADLYGLNEYDSSMLANDPELSSLFMKTSDFTLHYKALANWIIGPVRNFLQFDETASIQSLKPSLLAELIGLVQENRISHANAIQKILPKLFEPSAKKPSLLMEEESLTLLQSDDELDTWINEVLQGNREKVIAYRKGKKGLLSLFIGEVMKRSKGRADAKRISEKITEQLNKNDE